MLTRIGAACGALALFVALGGDSFARDAASAAAKVIDGKTVKKETITGTQVKNGSLGVGELSSSARRALTGARGATGPAGPTGAQGPQGPQGLQGATGTVDTSSFFTKTESDGRYPQLTTLDQFGLVLGRRNVGEDNSTGRSRVAFGRRVVAGNTANADIIGVAGQGKVRLSCGPGGGSTIEYVNLSAGSQDLVRESGSPRAVTGSSLAPGAQTQVTVSGVDGRDQLVLQVGSGETTGSSGAVTTFVVSVLNQPGGDPSCRAWGHVVGGTL
jgi:hypothetical protein